MVAREEFTATLTTLRKREAMRSQPDGMAIRVISSGQSIPLRAKRILGGRAPGHPIALSAPSISGTHFELRLTPEGTVTLRDLGSKNGVRIGGVRIHEAELEPGARFWAGEVELELSQVERREVPVSLHERFGAMLGRGTAMGRLFAELSRLAELPVDVLLRGETGTGKELVAHALHEHSPRRAGPFVVLDCTSLPVSLAESLLFGHRRGAFTGANEDSRGYFEDAHGGTLFIDEIAKLPLDLQAKLLRAVESREIVRVGETRRRPVDVRIIAATNRDLAQLMASGDFLEDLYYRLGGIEIEIPPLRARGRSNLVFLADAFLERVIASQTPRTLGAAAYEAMLAYPWPGNVRELLRVIERACFWATGPTIEPEHLRLPRGGQRTSSVVDDLFAMPYKDARAEFDAQYLRQLWPEVDGNVSEAARRMGIDRRTLTKLADRLGLRDTEGLP